MMIMMAMKILTMRRTLMIMKTCIASIDNCGECLPLHPHHLHLSTHLLDYCEDDDDDIDDDDGDDLCTKHCPEVRWDGGKDESVAANLGPIFSSNLSFVIFLAATTYWLQTITNSWNPIDNFHLPILPSGRLAPLFASSHQGKGKLSWMSGIRISIFLSVGFISSRSHSHKNNKTIMLNLPPGMLPPCKALLLAQLLHPPSYHRRSHFLRT